MPKVWKQPKLGPGVFTQDSKGRVYLHTTSGARKMDAAVLESLAIREYREKAERRARVVRAVIVGLCVLTLGVLVAFGVFA